MNGAEHDAISVRVMFFGAARDATGHGEIEMRLPAPATGESALAELLALYPALARFGRSLLFAVNYEYAAAGQQIKSGDELAVFPPVSGGSGEHAPSIITNSHPHDFFELTTAAIDVGEVARRVILRECGATVTLDGYARESTAGRPPTLYLVYEAYAPMALRELARLGDKAHEIFPQIAHIGIVHRTGRTEIGETSVVISVSAPHRRAAFAACEWAIKELKRTVPIWKKEYFADGAVWVEGEGSQESGEH